VFIAFLALPFYLMALNPEPRLLPIEYAGAAVWLIGIIGESVADRQLKRFKDDPANKGRTCQAGLWSLSRHPNYFFEWIIWVGYGIAALGSPFGWLGLCSPVVMLYVLVFVTGIPLTEEQALRSRSDYREYQRTTSPFIPWFKRA
jgi:steroid 5-alpha reductase family enzyme